MCHEQWALTVIKRLRFFVLIDRYVVNCRFIFCVINYSCVVHAAGEHWEGDWNCNSKWWDLCCSSTSTTQLSYLARVQRIRGTLFAELGWENQLLRMAALTSPHHDSRHCWLLCLAAQAPGLAGRWAVIPDSRSFFRSLCTPQVPNL